MIVNNGGNHSPARTLSNSGCSKSIFFKEFTNQKQRKSSQSGGVTYQTYGGKFHTTKTAGVGFWMVKFENNNSITVEHTFQIDERQKSSKVMYDMIIGNDLMWNMRIDILYIKEFIEWIDDAIPLKRMGTIQDVNICEMLYSIHTDSPLL